MVFLWNTVELHAFFNENDHNVQIIYKQRNKNSLLLVV